MKIEPFVNKYNWEGIDFPLEQYDWKKLTKAIEQLLLMFCMLKKKKNTPFMFQNVTQIVKNSLFF